MLVVEDDYFLADELAYALQELGAEIVGPVGSVKDALHRIASSDGLDGALLDINLRGERAFPVAEALIARGVPFVFTTGYDRIAIPQPYARIPLCGKPTDPSGVAAHLLDQIERTRR